MTDISFILDHNNANPLDNINLDLQKIVIFNKLLY